MSYGSYDLNLVSKRLILVGDIRSRSWPNIGDSYGTFMFDFSFYFFHFEIFFLVELAEFKKCCKSV